MEMKQLRFLVGFALVVSGCHDGPTSLPGARPANQSAVRNAVPGTGIYIVRFRNDAQDVSALADKLVAAHGGRLKFKYHLTIKGFAAEFSDQEITALARDPAVVSIEPEHVFFPAVTQSNPPSWGLDRIDQRALPLDHSYRYFATGKGVKVYILDTGIWYDHVEFDTARAVKGVDEVDSGGTARDCDGHGTHVAGTVGGLSVGVAKGVTLVSVRVLDCYGPSYDPEIIAGVEWVTAQKDAYPSVPMVANMSLVGAVDTTLNDAITASIAAGVTYVVAAGNSSDNACNWSPASTPNAITVGATDSTDAMWSGSNYGACLKIFAPGVIIKSAVDSSDFRLDTMSGTSMASPHVAGAAALYLQMHPSASPAAVAAFLTDSATLNVITGIGANSPNKLLYTAPFPVLNVTMSGPSQVRPNQSCGWWANPTGGRPPYSYSWFPTGSGGGDPNEVIESFASSDTLRVTVTDSTSQQASAKMGITVSSSAPRTCPYGPVRR